MRVTAENKAATRRRILLTARRLFSARGFETVSTRDIAESADIATGTLFNYFPTKEALLACLVSAAMDESQRDFRRHPIEAESAEEELFAFIAAGLRALKPLRKHLTFVFQTWIKPPTDSPDEVTRTVRVSHLETVRQIAAKHNLPEPSPAALHLFWMLHIGVLAFWSNDGSPKQQDTVALLDDSLSMFVGWLQQHPEAGAQRP